MKTSHAKRAACIVASLIPLLCAQAQTASTPKAAAPPPNLFDKYADQIKRPVDWMNWGADMRIRNEYYNNTVSLTEKNSLHEQDVMRYRGRVWSSFFPISGLSLNARVSAEPRQWLRPSFTALYQDGKLQNGQTGMDWRYGILDVLNLKWTNAFNQPLTITAGRQDISFGEFWNWWLVADGTPGDGSWSFFMDSIRLTYDAQDLKTKFDLVYIYQNARPDEWLPTLGRSFDAYLTEQNEQGVIVYASNKSLKNTQLDGYFMYKRDDRVFPQNGDNAALSRGDNADIYTLGGKVVVTPWEHWQFGVEGAYQFGEKEDPTLKFPTIGGYRDIDAYGANARITYLFKDSLNNQVHILGEFLSGDDPNTGNDEMFDILWGRWPRFSEGYIYSYPAETSGKIAQMNNLARVGAGWSLNPIKNMTFSAIYNAWFAPEEVPTRALNAAVFSKSGNFRAHYLQTILKHQFNKHIATHLWGEFMWSGDYYADHPFMDFLRAEVLLTF